MLVSAFVKALNKALKLARKLSQMHQDTLGDHRLKDVDPRKKNTCQHGDFTLKEPDMSESYIGLWKVEYLHGYDVTYRHVVQNTRYMFPVRHVKIYAKTHEQAFKAASLYRN